MTYGLYAFSHWQGSGPGTLIATGPKAVCDAGENALSTCSFCRPGRTSNYNTGSCYDVRKVKYVPRNSTPAAIPADAAEWGRHDWHAWAADN